MDNPGITLETEPYFKNGLWGWDGSQWRKNNLIWSYHSRYVENLGDLNPAGGTYQKTSTAVPDGYVYVVNGIYIANATAARDTVVIYLALNGVSCFVLYNVAPVVGVPDLVLGSFVLSAGDYAVVTQYSIEAGDDMYAAIWGYKMQIAA